MKYLSGLDNLFLHQETPTQHMHVGGLGVYDPSTAPGGKVRFKTVLNFFTRRMAEAPVFRRRLGHSPLHLDRPFWIEDPEVDVEYHVRHLALPNPGDWRQLMIQIARIHSRPLDLSKPLWEAYIIEGLDNIPGLPNGGFALYLKFHHAVIDGEAAAHLIGSLHTLEAGFDAASSSAKPTLIADREPSTVELVSRAMSNRARQVIGAGKLSAMLGKQMITTASKATAFALTDTDKFLAEQFDRSRPKRPQTPFNEPVSSHRALDAIGISLQDCDTIRAHVAGCTINDILLTTVGGALARYLTAQREAPLGSLLGTMPMTLRGEDKDCDEGNQIGQVYYSLHTDIEDPVARLRAIRGETEGLKSQLNEGLGPDFQKHLLDVLPATLIAKQLVNELASNSNVNISNVRGPNRPLFMAGARLERFIPFSLVFDGCGLNITGFSYNGTLWVAVTCCRDMLPDPAAFCRCLREAFEQLKSAAQDTASDDTDKADSATTTGKARRPKRARKLAATSIASARSKGAETDSV